MRVNVSGAGDVVSDSLHPRYQIHALPPGSKTMATHVCCCAVSRSPVLLPPQRCDQESAPKPSDHAEKCAPPSSPRTASNKALKTRETADYFQCSTPQNPPR